MKGLLKRKDGYVLAWVICVFLVAAILSGIAISVSIMATQTTRSQHSRQQVYYTAKSVISSVADYINDNAANTELINNLINNQGSGSTPNMGDYTVDVSYVSQSKIKIKATANFQGEAYTMSAYLVNSPAPSGILPTDNVFFINGSASEGFGACNIYGNVYIDGDFKIGSGSTIDGFTVVKGDATIVGGAHSTSGLFSFGNVEISGGAHIWGDVLTKGDLIMSGNSQVYGDAYVDGSLNFIDGAIRKDATVGNNADFSGGENKILGSLKYGGKVFCSYGSVSTFVNNGATKISDYTPINESPYTAQPLPIINVPTKSEKPQLYNTVVLNNNTISESGTITSSVMSQINQRPDDTKITIDASSQDIHLLLNNTTFNLENGIDIYVDSDGTHNVFIYMTGSSSISIAANSYVGMKVIGTNPRLFIIGDGNQSVNLSSTSELDACIYIPKGTFSAHGDEIRDFKLIGSCIVENVNISSNLKYHHSKPDISNTPLDIFQNGQSGSGNGAWVLGGWGKS